MSSNPTFQRIALMGRQRQNGIEDTLFALHDYLQKNGFTVVFEQQTAAHIDLAVTRVPSDELPQACDILLVVGGDGSMLYAAQMAASHDIPVLGINRGRLGFLTDMYPQHLEKIKEVLQGHYYEEHRFLLNGCIDHQSKRLTEFAALNEIVLSPGETAHMLEFDVLINEQFMCEFSADGLIVATPTGSTAYALSGGGPILHPGLNAFVLVPMFPHTLSNRPIVVDANSSITIQISANNSAAPFVSGDGQKRMALPLGASLTLTKKKEQLRLIHPLDYRYFDTLRAKLGWQSRNPAYKNRC